MSRKNLALMVIAVFAITAAGMFVAAENMRGSAALRQNLIGCANMGRTYEVNIKNNKLSTASIHANRCDQLEITNLDSRTREIGFGVHDHHVPYDGVSEKVLGKGGSFAVTLDKAGTYHFHDHFQDDVTGTFIVTD
jgi:hypothetical protein